MNRRIGYDLAKPVLRAADLCGINFHVEHGAHTDPRRTECAYQGCRSQHFSESLGTALERDDTTVQIFDASTGQQVLTYRGHTAGLGLVIWSFDGKYIASGSDDPTVQVWEASTGRHILTYNSHTLGVGDAAWSRDSSRIASGSQDPIVQVWEAATGSHIFTYKGHTGWVTAVAWSPDGTRIASGDSGGTVQVWQAR